MNKIGCLVFIALVIVISGLGIEGARRFDQDRKNFHMEQYRKNPWKFTYTEGESMWTVSKDHTLVNEKDGLWTHRDIDGNITKTERYKDGEKDGLWTYRDKEGNVTKTERYKDGKLVK